MGLRRDHAEFGRGGLRGRGDRHRVGRDQAPTGRGGGEFTVQPQAQGADRAAVGRVEENIADVIQPLLIHRRHLGQGFGAGGVGVDGRVVIENTVPVVARQVGGKAKHQPLGFLLFHLRLQVLQQGRVADDPGQVLFRETGLPGGGDVAQPAKVGPVEVQEAVEHAVLALERQATLVGAQHQFVEVQRSERVLPGAHVDKARRCGRVAAKRVAEQLEALVDQRVLAHIPPGGQLAAGDHGLDLVVAHGAAGIVPEQVPFAGDHRRGQLRGVARYLQDITGDLAVWQWRDRPRQQGAGGVLRGDVEAVQEPPVHLHLHRIVERVHVVVVSGRRVPEQMAAQVDTREIQYAHVRLLSVATGRV